MSHEQKQDYISFLETYLDDYEKKYKLLEKISKEKTMKIHKLEKERDRLLAQLKQVQDKDLYKENVELRVKVAELKKTSIKLDSDFVPHSENDFKRYRKMNQKLLDEKKRLQTLVDELKKENAELKVNKIYYARGK